ncbi:DinB family protein [Zhihengliuella somnathii]
MSESEILNRYLQEQREALLGKLDGVSEYDARRPCTATGTNLLGLVKHVATMEIGYFGEVCGRQNVVPIPWIGPDAEPNADLFATAEQSRDWVVELYRTAWADTDRAIAELGLDAEAYVPWWGERIRQTTVRRLVVHLFAEIARHAGHADIIREGIGGVAGLAEGNGNLPDSDAQWWTDYRAGLQTVADQFA